VVHDHASPPRGARAEAEAPALARWRDRIAAAVRELLRDDGSVTVRAGARQASLLYTSNAAAIVCLAGLSDRIGGERHARPDRRSGRAPHPQERE